MTHEGDLDLALESAIACHEAGQFELAEAGYRHVLRQNPDEPDALNLLGLLLQNRGNLSAAMELLEHALTIEPAFPEALTNLARAQQAAGNASAASDAARKAIALDNGLGEAHLQLGHALAALGQDMEAAVALEQARALMPDSVDAICELGAVRLRLKDYDAAVELLRLVLERVPGRTDAMLNLGLAFAGLDQLDEALRWTQKAAEAEPANASAIGALAILLRRQMDLNGSVEACRRTLELSPERVDIWLLLGSNIAEAGAFDEAERCFRKALTLAPDSAQARQNLAMIGRLPNDDRDINSLQATVTDASAQSADRIAAGFALGIMLEKSADYDGAFEAFQHANQIAHAGLVASGKAFDVAGMRAYVDWAIQTFTKDLFGALGEFGDLSEVPVFIVGMPRSGTSLVEQIAASHPDVFGAGERRDIGDLVARLGGGTVHCSPSAWDRQAVQSAVVSHVQAIAAMGRGAKRVIDKMPDNILLLGQIALLFPNARIIVCRRDPRDVCVSCYTKPFGAGIPWTHHQTELAVRATEIERLMSHWRSVVPSRILEFPYEDLIADQEGQSRRLTDFLDLEWDPACLDFNRTARPVTTASYFEVRQPLYDRSVGRWRRFRKHLAPLLAFLTPISLACSDDDWDMVASDPAAASATAAACHQVGNLAGAESLYRALLRQAPSDPTLLHMLGLVRLDRGDWSDSIVLLRQSTDLRPEFAPAWSDLARSQWISGDLDEAVACARRALTLQPTLTDAHNQLGVALILQGNYDEAIRIYRQALEIDSDSTRTLRNLANALAETRDYSALLEILERLAEAEQQDVEVWVGLGNVLSILNNFAEAEAIFKKALVLSPDHPMALRGMGALMLQLGRTVEASSFVGKALELSPKQAELWNLRGLIDAALGHFADAAEAWQRMLELEPESVSAISGLLFTGNTSHHSNDTSLLQRIVQDESGEVRLRAVAAFTLGQHLEKERAYDDAFEAFIIGNRLNREDLAVRDVIFSREHQRMIVDWLIGSFSPSTFWRMAGKGETSELPVFVVGLPRSGTTLVEQIAASHPRVYGAGEMTDFQHILATMSGGKLEIESPLSWQAADMRREARAYLETLRNVSGGAARVVDKLPANVMWLGHIASLFPRARIVICRRDLRDVCMSCFSQMFLGDGLAWTYDLADCGFFAREVDRLMTHWAKVLPVPPLVVEYEKLVGDLEGESRRLIDYLGLDWDPACLSFHETERTVLTASQWQVRQPLYSSSVGKWRRYEKHLGPLFKELQEVIPPDS